MPNATAKALKEALEAGASVRTLADQLMTEIAPKTSGLLDVGVRLWLVITPGYGPLSDPADHFFVVEEI